MRYRKIPIEIDAIQFTGSNIDSVAEFTECIRYEIDDQSAVIYMDMYQFTVNINEYIIKDKAGVYYLMPNSIFRLTYELFEENLVEEEL